MAAYSIKRASLSKDSQLQVRNPAMMGEQMDQFLQSKFCKEHISD